MRSIILLSVFVFGTGLLQAQTEDQNPINLKVTITTDDNSRYIRTLTNEFVRNLKGDFKLSSNAIFELSVSYVIEKAKTIEGVDTKTFQKVKFESRLTDMISEHELWTGSKAIEGKGTNSDQAIKSALSKYARSREIKEELVVLATEHIASQYVEGCANALTTIPRTGSMEVLNRSLVAIEYMMESDCAESSASASSEIIDNIDARMCEVDLHALKIKVNSGQYNTQEAVAQLLQFSPTAPCSEDVVVLAEVIGSQRSSRISSREKETVEKYLVIIVDSDNLNQQALYRRLRWAYD